MEILCGYRAYDYGACCIITLIDRLDTMLSTISAIMAAD